MKKLPLPRLLIVITNFNFIDDENPKELFYQKMDDHMKAQPQHTYLEWAKGSNIDLDVYIFNSPKVWVRTIRDELRCINFYSNDVDYEFRQQF